MIKKILFFLFLYCINTACAETIKTDVLVIGGSASGTAAAIQSARSKIKTILVEPGPWLGGSMTSGGICIFDANKNIPSGIYGEFRKRVMQFYKNTPGYDTTYNATLRLEPYTGAAILKKISDTVKNLTVKLNTPWTTVKKDDTGWDITITQNGSSITIKTKVLIDATEFADVAAKAGATLTSGAETRQDTGEQLAPETASATLRNLTWAIVLKDYGKAGKTINKPENYNLTLYTCLKAGDMKGLLTDGKLPSDKYLLNCCANSYPVTAEQLSLAKREEYFKNLRLQTLGLVYYLQTELGYKNLGLSDDFSTTDHLPYEPYVREYRHIKGEVRMVTDDIYIPYNRSSKLYRTAIAVADAMPEQHSDGTVNYPPFPAYTIPLGAVVVKDMENLIVTENAISVTHLVGASTCNPAVQMTLGQGAGTVAAFCAFFKTTTRHLNVRAIQGELLDFKGYLVPISDIPVTDPDFRAIQQVCATGLLQTHRRPLSGNALQLVFDADSAVRTAEVKPVLNEIYTRGFLWFNKTKPGEFITVANLLSLISEITLSEPKPLQAELQKEWKTRYKFKDEFDLNRPVTRREFAVLANKYLNPFARRVDLSGHLVN